MANETIRARIEVLLKGLDQVESLKNAVRQLQTTAAPASADLQKLKNAAMQLGSASGRTENDLRRSISALKDVRAQLSLTDRDYQKLTGTINKYQAQLDKATGAQQQGGRGMRFAQTAGAVAASGVFGGPEGLIGAGIGAFFGPGGALAGGAIGAQVGMTRQQIGVLATYAADIQKAEIALKGITKTQVEYQRALAASASVTRDFNVPQLEATKGMTQLSAAVIGAGGKVADAEVVFRNVTAAIKASGGTSEDVQGALTALGQVFSKGKVSAEELQGQLGERLPGAVTMFAKATGRTLPQLQKDLEQGVVGLADLMKFITSDQGLGQFEQRAKAVADSSAEAGARLTTTWNDTKRAIGEALLPLGAQIQDSLANALRNATPALVSFAQGIASLIKLFVDNAGLISGVLKTLLGFGAIAGAAVGVTQLAGAIGTAVLAIKSMGGAMSATTLAARTLGVSIAAIPGIGWLAAGITALGLLTVELYNNNKAFRTWANNLATVIATDFKNAWDNAVSITSAATRDIGNLLSDLSGIASSVGSAISARIENAFGGITVRVREFWNSLPEPIRRAMSQGASAAFGGLLAPGNPAVGYVIGAGVRAAQMGPNAQDSAMFGRYDVAGGKTDNLTAGSLTNFGQQTDDESKRREAADKARSDAERLAAEQQRLDEAVAKAEIQLAQTVFNNQIELIKKRYDYEQERIQMQRDIWAGTFEGIRSESARAANEFISRLEEVRQRSREAALNVVVAEQTAAFNARMEAVTAQNLSIGGGGSSFTGGARTSRTRDPDAEATGWDIVMPGGQGAPVRAPIDLTITGTGFQGRGAGSTGRGYGNWLSGEFTLGGKKYELLLGHFDRIDVAPGMQVPAGTSLGAQGITGRTFGTHVTTHVNPRAGATVGDAWNALEALTQVWEKGRSIPSSPPTGVAAQTRRNVAAGGRLVSADAEVDQAKAMVDLEAAQSKFLLQNEGVRYVQQRTQGLRDEAKAMENNNALLLKRMQLEQAGLRPELIDAQMKIAEIEQQRAEKLAQINENIQANQYDAEAVAGFRLEIEDTNAAYDRQIAAVNALAQAQTAAGTALKTRIGQLRQELQQLATMENFIVNMSQTIESSFSTAISSAVTNLVTGAQTIKQTLAEMFRSIGEAFIKMAADIIAKQLMMVALNQILRIFGGGVGASPAPPSLGDTLKGIQSYGFASGGVMTNVGPLPLKRYAAGGVAKSPQMAVYGERGPEAYVPLPDGRSIPVKMKQRTEALNRYRPIGATGTISDGEGGMAGGAGGAAGGGAIDVRYTVERINNVEYVTADQFQQGMRQAAAQGAQRGEQRALRSLQQSTAVRNRIGMR